jgi:hypothetical protein
MVIGLVVEWPISCLIAMFVLPRVDLIHGKVIGDKRQKFSCILRDKEKMVWMNNTVFQLKLSCLKIYTRFFLLGLKRDLGFMLNSISDFMIQLL